MRYYGKNYKEQKNNQMKKICAAIIFVVFLSGLHINGQLPRRGNQQFIINQQVRNLYRKPSKKEAELLAPRIEDQQKYAEFLQKPDTGLIKLMPDLGCGENPKVLVATDVCQEYTMPGGGSAYSFRKENYRIWRLADILHKDGIIHAIGARSQGILVTLGDVPLEGISLDTEGLKFLTDFEPKTEFEEAKEQNRKLLEGITYDGFYYRKALRAVENTTYVLRSVAYRGKFYRAIQDVVYNELDYDKRRDIIVAFRIVRQDKTDGSITLLWRTLANEKSPKLEVEKELINEDF